MLPESDIQHLVRSTVAQTLAQLPQSGPVRIAYTVPQAAEAVGLPYSTLRDRVSTGEIRAVKRAGKWLILHSDLMRWLADS
jgi:excisionase family DNA binding protein